MRGCVLSTYDNLVSRFSGLSRLAFPNPLNPFNPLTKIEGTPCAS